MNSSLKRKISVMLAALIIILMLGSDINVMGAETNIENDSFMFEYPITPGDPEWAQLGSVENKIAACRIPKSVLETMTNKQLIQAVMDFPFLIDLFLCSSFESSVKAFEKTSDAYAELISREGAKDDLVKAIGRGFNLQSKGFTANDEIKNDALAIMTLYQDNFKQSFTIDEINDISASSNLIKAYIVNANSDLSKSLSYTIKTPNGTVVLFANPECVHSDSAHHSKLDQQTVDTYGVTLVSGGTCKYNCHSYAWFNKSASNIYWINDPMAYMTDGSYNRVVNGLNSSSLNAVSGDKVFYGTSTDLEHAHSAVLTSSASGAPLATRTVESKWGTAGVFRHSVANVPSVYNKDTVTAWHR